MSLKRLKFNFRNQSAADTISQCERTAQNLAALPPEHLHQESYAELAATVAAIRASHDHIASLRGQLREEITRRNTLLKTVRNQTMRAVGFAASNMNHDPVKLLATGLPLHAEKTSTGQPAAPTNLRAEPTASEGEAQLRWVRPLRLCTFQIQVQAEPLHDDGWKFLDSCTRQTCAVKGLTSGGKFWFRVRAVNPHGTGPWSNLAPVRVK